MVLKLLLTARIDMTYAFGLQFDEYTLKLPVSMFSEDELDEEEEKLDDEDEGDDFGDDDDEEDLDGFEVESGEDDLGSVDE